MEEEGFSLYKDPVRSCTFWRTRLNNYSGPDLKEIHALTVEGRNGNQKSVDHFLGVRSLLWDMTRPWEKLGRGLAKQSLITGSLVQSESTFWPFGLPTVVYVVSWPHKVDLLCPFVSFVSMSMSFKPCKYWLKHIQTRSCSPVGCTRVSKISGIEALRKAQVGLA